MDIFLNWLIQFYFNNTINLSLLTQRIMSCYTHKMAIVSWVYWGGVYAGIRRIPTSGFFWQRILTSCSCSLAVLDPRVGHTMDVLSPFIPVLCHSDWLTSVIINKQGTFRRIPTSIFSNTPLIVTIDYVTSLQPMYSMQDWLLHERAWARCSSSVSCRWGWRWSTTRCGTRSPTPACAGHAGACVRARHSTLASVA